MTIYSVRFRVLSTAALDGTTPVPTDPTVVDVGEVPGKGIVLVTVPALLGAMGVFDPGAYITSGQSSNWLLLSLTVVPDSGTPGDGGAAVARIQSPDLPGGGSRQLEVIDLAAPANGIVQSAGIVVPVEHKVAVDTSADGAVGPYVVQMSYLKLTDASGYGNLTKTQ